MPVDNEFTTAKPSRADFHPADESSGYGPWFVAGYDSECDGCPAGITEGEDSRSDGAGGWLCTSCGEQG